MKTEPSVFLKFIIETNCLNCQWDCHGKNINSIRFCYSKQPKLVDKGGTKMDDYLIYLIPEEEINNNNATFVFIMYMDQEKNI